MAGRNAHSRADIGQQRTTGEKDARHIGVAAAGHLCHIAGLWLIIVGPVLLGENIPHLGRATDQLVFLDGGAELLPHHLGGVKAIVIGHDPDQLLGSGTLIESAYC